MAQSLTESECISLSAALREAIFLMELMKEMQKMGICEINSTPSVYCKAFEDNSGAVEMARMPRLCPRTKHINVKCHHFKQYVFDKVISIYQVSTLDQNADLFTKALSFKLFNRHRWRVCG